MFSENVSEFEAFFYGLVYLHITQCHCFVFP